MITFLQIVVRSIIRPPSTFLLNSFHSSLPESHCSYKLLYITLAPSQKGVHVACFTSPYCPFLPQPTIYIPDKRVPLNVTSTNGKVENNMSKTNDIWGKKVKSCKTGVCNTCNIFTALPCLSIPCAGWSTTTLVLCSRGHREHAAMLYNLVTTTTCVWLCVLQWCRVW